MGKGSPVALAKAKKYGIIMFFIILFLPHTRVDICLITVRVLAKIDNLFWQSYLDTIFATVVLEVIVAYATIRNSNITPEKVKSY